MTQLEFDKLWHEWSANELTNYSTKKDKNGKDIRVYLKKGYLHLDNKYWFPSGKEKIKKILNNKLRVVKNGTHEQWWDFKPFIKLLIKSPRYKYDADNDEYNLETKIRPICYASHVDSLIYGFYSHALTQKYEEFIKPFDECVLAYRTNLDGKCNIQFSKEAFTEIRNRKECTAIALDIKGYFDNIRHDILLEKWQKILGGRRLSKDEYRIYLSITNYSYISKNSISKKYNINHNSTIHNLLEVVPGQKVYEKFDRLRSDQLIVKHENDRGIPQGSGISALMSNVYLIDFDDELYKKSINESFIYRRYCDDILIICDSDKAEDLHDFIINKIDKEYDLKIQPRKVDIIDFRMNSKGKIRAFNRKKLNTTNANSPEKYHYKSLQYLGFEFNGQNILVRSSSLSRYFRKMKARITKTILMAYSRNGKSNKIFKRQIFERYTHLGKRNFIQYVYNASKEEYINSNGIKKDGMGSQAMRKQIARHFNILMESLSIKNAGRYNLKDERLKKKRKPKRVKKKEV